MMIALLLSHNVHVCARMHHRRHVDFRRGRRLGKDDHLILWTKPQRPDWMDQATYDALPDTLQMRELRYHVVQPGHRTQTIVIATTLTDAETYSKEDIAQLYGFRWNSELDIRSIKQSLNLSHVRSKSPAMVRKSRKEVEKGTFYFIVKSRMSPFPNPATITSSWTAMTQALLHLGTTEERHGPTRCS